MLKHLITLCCVTGAFLLCAAFVLGRIDEFPVYAEEVRPDEQNSVPAFADGLNNSESEMNNSSNDTDSEKPEEDGWQLVLVNALHPIDGNFTPLLTDIGEGFMFDQRAAQYLSEMLQAAEKDGLSPLVCSAYRTEEIQQELYEKKVAVMRSYGYSYQNATDKAKTIVAYPGTSEHQIGLAVDIVAVGYQTLDRDYEKTKMAKWLLQNCSEYGFVLRYPKNKTDITGVIYEPWHFRYVGKEAAEVIMENDFCLEEYLEQ